LDEIAEILEHAGCVIKRPQFFELFKEAVAVPGEGVRREAGVQPEQDAHAVVVQLGRVLDARDERRQPALAAARHRVRARHVQAAKH